MLFLTLTVTLKITVISLANIFMIVSNGSQREMSMEMLSGSDPWLASLCLAGDAHSWCNRGCASYLTDERRQ